MISPRYAQFAFAFFLSMIMSFIISGVATISALGIDAELPGEWFLAWLTSWTVAFPSVLVVAPITRRIVGVLVKSAN